MLSTIEDCLARLEASVDGRLARLEAATGLAVPVVQETGTTTDDEKLDKISDLVASLEQKVESNQESVVLIGDKLGEIVSCLAELKSEAKSEASAAREIQTAQLVEAKAANRQRIMHLRFLQIDKTWNWSLGIMRQKRQETSVRIMRQKRQETSVRRNSTILR
eukprot:scaffold2909_cov78-Cylindrotheca_fusiformis.AAC.7